MVGLSGIDSTNSAPSIGPGLGICAVVGGAGVTGVYYAEFWLPVFFNNLVLAVLKMGQMSESVTFPKCKLMLAMCCFFSILVYVKK